MLTTTVENYPGFVDGVQGPELIDLTRKQAQKFGAKVVSEDVTGFEIGNGKFTVSYGKGEKVEAISVIIATGASARTLGLEAEKTYMGRGIHTCATCDAYFYQGKEEAIVIGGGDSACEEALELSKFVNHVTIVHRRDELRASKIMQKRVFDNKKIDIMWDTSVEEISGDDKKATSVKLKNIKTGKVEEKKMDGIFMAIGHIPNTKLFDGKLELDKKNYLVADKETKTSVPGVFAAGDVADQQSRIGYLGRKHFRRTHRCAAGCAAVPCAHYRIGTVRDHDLWFGNDRGWRDVRLFEHEC